MSHLRNAIFAMYKNGVGHTKTTGSNCWFMTIGVQWQMLIENEAIYKLST